MTKEKNSMNELLAEMKEIIIWFEKQKEPDIEMGLSKMKDAAKLIKSARARLADIENEFKAVEKELATD